MEPKLYFICLYILMNQEAAETIVKEVCAAGKRGALLYAEAYKRCAAFCREQEPQDFTAFADAELQEGEKLSDLLQLLERQEPFDPELLEQCRTVLSDLPYKLRSTLLFSLCAGMAAPEIAQMESVSEQVIQNRLYSALIQLQKKDSKILPAFRAVLQELERQTETAGKPRKNRLIAIPITIGILALALCAASIYFAAKKPEAEPEPQILQATSTPTVSPTATKAPTPLPTQSPLPVQSTPKGKTYPVLSKLRYADGGYLTCHYTENTIELYAADGVRKLTLEYDENGVKVSETRYTNENIAKKWQFDAAGNVTQYTEYSDYAAHSVKLQSTYQYDSNGKLTKKTTVYGDASSSTFEYDADGFLIKQITIPRHDDSFYTTYEYDRSGRLLRETDYDGDKVFGRDEYIYDENGHLLQEKHNSYSLTGCPYTNYINEYDKNGKIVRTLQDYAHEIPVDYENLYAYEPNGNRFYREWWEHFTGGVDLLYLDGQLEGEVIFNKDGIAVPYAIQKRDDGSFVFIKVGYETEIGNSCKYEYDTNGNIIKCTYYDTNGHPKYYYKCEYDQRNRRVNERHYYYYFHDEYGTLNLYCEYQYDDAGNLIKLLDYGNDYFTSTPYATYTFNEFGQLRNFSRQDKDVSIDFEYFKTGRLMKRKLDFIDNNNPVSVVCEYDETGNVLRRTISRDGRFYEMNEKMQLVSVRSAADAASDPLYTCEYLENGCLYRKTEADTTTEYLYDEQENRIGWIKYDSRRQPVFQYFYPHDSDHSKIVPPTGSENLQQQGEFVYDANGKLTAWKAYDRSGTEFVGEYEEMGESAYAVFQHCNIMELLP